MAEIRYNNSFSLAGGFNITNAEPIDSRTFVSDISHIYLPENWDKVKPYPGLIVSDPKGEVRICLNSDYTLESSWGKIGGNEIETINETISGITDSISGITDNVSSNTESIKSIEETLKTMSDNDTKNTAGSSNSEEKLYLIGASEQNGDGIETYSNTNVWMSGGTLYMGNKAVAINDDVETISNGLTSLSETVGGINDIVTAHTETLSEHYEAITKNTQEIKTVNNTVTSHTETLGEYYDLITGNTQEIETIKQNMASTVSYGDGLGLSGNTVNVLIADDNHLTLNDLNELTVTGITTDDTFVSEEITIEGGPLADIAKKVYTDGKIPVGTSIQEFLKNLLCVEIYPIASSSSGSFSLSLSSPSISANVSSDSLVEVGKNITINAVTAKSVSTSVTNPEVSGFEHGYSDTIDGAINTSTTITDTMSYSQKSGEVYSLSASKSGFVGDVPASASNAAYDSCSLASVTLTASLGSNKYTVTETGPIYTYSYAGIGAKYIVSNLGERSERHKSAAVAAKSATDSNRPTASSTYSVTGVYPVYTNISGGALIADASAKQTLQTSATFTFTSVPGEVGSNPFMFDFPSTKSISSFKIKDPSGNWTNFSAAYTTDTTVTKTINGTSYTYKRLKTDGTQGEGNTYQIVLNSALNA